MLKKKLTVFAALLLNSLITGVATGADQVTSSYTPQLDAHIVEVVKNYLISHPEILIEVSQKLQQEQLEQQTKAIGQATLRYRDLLLNDIDTPSYGPLDAKVALVEFFDYQCVVCARQAPVLKTVMNNNPQVRYIFKEWPIFGQRWSSSLTAAEAGLLTWQNKGSDAYLAYHNAVFATGHNEGNLTPGDIKESGGSLEKNGKILAELERTDELAQKLGLQGTPAIIVMPVEGASVDNITIIPGGANQKILQEAIHKAAGSNETEQSSR